MSRRNKKTPEDKPKADAWLTTYSDMITLVLTFFILLFSFSTMDVIKWQTIVKSLQGALGPLDKNNSIVGETVNESEREQEIDRNKDITEDITEEFLRYQEETRKLEEIRAQLNRYVVEKGLENNVFISIEERGLVLRLQDSVLFEKSKADLMPESNGILKEVTAVLTDIENPLRIEGHTDDLPIHTEKFPSNWELSTTRATNVLRYLMNNGFEGARLSAVGYGEYHPIASNDSEENRSKNRRVDIVIIRDSLIVNEPN